MKSVARSRPWCPPRSAFAGYRFPAEVIVVAVRWYLRYGLLYRDVEELLAERVDVDHVTVYRWGATGQGGDLSSAPLPAAPYAAPGG